MENITVTKGTKSVSDGKITLTATSADCYTDRDEASWKNNGIKTIPCKPNTKYTFSWEYEGDSEGDVYIFENGSTNNIGYTHNNAGKLLITTSADAEFLTIRVGVSNSGTSITYWNFQLEEGTTDTPYEPYIPSVKMLADENAQQNDSLSSLGKCKNLLKPTLQTTTQNGVTCTNNGDGTYTLNGTNTASTFIFFQLRDLKDFTKRMTNKELKLVGCPAGGNGSTFNLQYEINNTPVNGGGYDFGDGVIVKNDKIASENITKAAVYIIVRAGTTLSNVVFKPMLTTNLNATYDDFVPYTGDGETLVSDVAELKNDLVPKKIELQNVDERVTIQDNGSFIINGFAFVNLLVTFNETLPQWSNFVRLPRPKGDDVPVHCENSVRFTIYGQDNLPGDCGTYNEVSSGTEVRLLVNYEVA